MPVSLKAGDGVVYLNCILHVSECPLARKSRLWQQRLILAVAGQWGSNYTSQIKRRTLHFGYRAINNSVWTQIQMPKWSEKLLPQLSPRLVPHFERWGARPLARAQRSTDK